jgi:hypothetical protein
VKKLVAACALFAAHGAWATGGVPCTSADQLTSLNVLVSLTGEGAGSGVVSLLLTQRGQPANAPWTVIQAKADYTRHTLQLKARRSDKSSDTARLAIRRGTGTLRLNGQTVRLSCDWGEFS